MKYKLRITENFIKRHEKLTSRNSSLKLRIKNVLQKLEEDPFYPGLKTHQVYTTQYGLVFSSRVTGDIRILWNMNEYRIYIFVLSIGGHEGGNKVYK